MHSNDTNSLHNFCERAQDPERVGSFEVHLDTGAGKVVEIWSKLSTGLASQHTLPQCAQCLSQLCVHDVYPHQCNGRDRGTVTAHIFQCYNRGRWIEHTGKGWIAKQSGTLHKDVGRIS